MSIEQRFEHGTVNGYTNHKCRCDECRSAWATYVRTYRDSNRERLRSQIRARSRAQTRLAIMHPSDFEVLVKEELSKEIGTNRIIDGNGN